VKSLVFFLEILSQKVDPYLRPLYDALYEMLGMEKTEKLLAKEYC
jgi:phosphate starvation-inducible PhoH-like protein